MVCYLLWVTRMKYCFLNTPYQPSTTTYKCMYIGIGLFFIFQMVMVLLLCLWQANVLNSSFLDLYDEINIIIKSFNHTIVSIALIYLFVSRLMRITVEVSEDDDYAYDRESSYNRESNEYLKSTLDKQSLMSSNEIKIRTEQPDLTDLQKSLIHIITKYTVLFTSMVVITEIYILFDVVLSGIYLFKERENILLETWDIKWILLGIDCVIMSLSLLLTFEFSDKWYNVCCKLCHLYCKVCYSSKAKHKISVYRLSKKHIMIKEARENNLKEPLMMKDYTL